MSNNSTSHKEKNIGFALSGGFIKGFAHLGAMQALKENDIHPEIISGVSAGALAGAFYADGNDPYRVLDYFSNHKTLDFTKFSVSKQGFFNLSELVDFLRSNLKAKSIEKLKVPMIITATDLDHGRSVHFRKGDIAMHVAASCCLPVMFSPIVIDGVHYVDGGIFMNFPVSTLTRECEKIVGINVSPVVATDYKKNMVSIGMRAYNFMFRANAFAHRERCDLLIEPYNLHGYSNRELEKAEEIFQQGYNTARETLARLKEEKGSFWRN